MNNSVSDRLFKYISNVGCLDGFTRGVVVPDVVVTVQC